MLFPRVAVCAVFLLDGAVYGSWAAQVPALARQAHTGTAALGLVLLGPAAAMVLTAAPAGRACARLGARTVTAASLAAGFAVLALVGTAGSALRLGLTLAALGGLMGMVDVGANVAAVAVVRALDRPLMPLFHAHFSLGGLVGAGGAALASALGARPSAALATVAATGAVVLAAVTRWLPDERAGAPAAGPRPRRTVVADRHLWAVAAGAVLIAVAEGACSEWSGVFLVRLHHTADAVGAGGYALFTAVVAVTRLTGERLERLLGPYVLVGGGALLAAAGLLLTAAAPSAAVAVTGLGLAGAGLACAFPVLVGLAGRTGLPGAGGGEREIAFVTTIAYTGMLAGPPLIGWTAGFAGLPAAMAAVATACAVVAPTAWLARRTAHPAEPGTSVLA